MIRIYLSTLLGERRLTQADLARMTGIRPSTINELYHELAERVSLEQLDRICDALQCELPALIGRTPNALPQTMSRTGNDLNNRK